MQRTFGNKIKTLFLKWGLLLALISVAVPGVFGQSGLVELSSRSLTREQLIDELALKTPYKYAVNKTNISMSEQVRFSSAKMALSAVLDQMLRGTGHKYTVNGNVIIVIPDNDAQTGSFGALQGTIVDEQTGEPLSGVLVQIVGTELFTTTDAHGKYAFAEVPAGNYVVKYASQEYGVNKYSQVRLSADGQATANINLSEKPTQAIQDMVIDIIEITSADRTLVTPSASNYISDRRINNYGRTDNENTYILVTPSDAARTYQPKVALKTNLLYLATTSPNMAAEFYLAPHWTLDAHLNWNPWKFNSEKGGIRHWFVQPEARYWFCNTFERHFIGIHGIYGQYEIGKIDLPFKDLTEKRYSGYGVGAGISYGYHLPISERWGLEFSLGIGYIYLNYDKYNCGTCNNKVGTFDRHYFGPTKAAVSLVFMIN